MTIEQDYVDACIKGDFARRARLEAELDKQTDDANNRLNAPDAIVKAALFYAKHNVAVFPCFGVRRYSEAPYACECPDGPRTDKNRCGSPGKHPRSRNGFKDATTDPAIINAWWQAWPNANVATPTGIHWDCIDIDGPEGVGATYFNGVEFPTELGHVLTPRQAGHHVLIAPTGAGNKQSMYPHVDFRGAGGYHVLPPSIGASGRRYRWSRPVDFAAIKAAT